MQNYTKLYTKVLEDTNDLVDTAIIGVILEKVKGNNKPKLQQTYIAERIKLDKDTIYKHIKELKKKGYINTKPTYYTGQSGIKQSTTEFEILPRLQRLIEDKPRNQETNTINKHISIVKTEDQKPNEIWQTLTEPIKKLTALNNTIQ